MAKNETMSVEEAVYNLQLLLLEGIKEYDQLVAAGSMMSRNDYENVVIERSIAKICGYPLCSNSLPSEQPRKGRYRISLKEHKVYDLQETYKYCSTSCVVNSRSFSGSLQEERPSVLNQAKLDDVLQLFEGLSLDSKEDLGKNGKPELKIQENPDAKAGEVSMSDWIGPSNAIEGYVPRKDRRVNSSSLKKNHKEGSKPDPPQVNTKKDMVFNEIDFTSVIISDDGYSITKVPKETVSDTISKEPEVEVLRKQMEDNFAISEIPSDLMQSQSKASNEEKKSNSGDSVESNVTRLKPSLKSSSNKKMTQSVTWADERINSNGSHNLCEFRESKDKNEAAKSSGIMKIEEDDDSLRLASAQACAEALNQAAESIQSRESDVMDAVSEAGIIILPPPQNMDETSSDEIDDVSDSEMFDESEQVPVKWPRKPGLSDDFFNSEDSWYDSPPEGFSLTLSPFASMFMALFSWISSSSLAYIYGRDGTSHEEYLCVNGREYPQRIVLPDGRSSEIKKTLAGCLARALPGLAAELRLPTPISTLEQAMALLLDTMSFVDPLPSLRMKQWQVVTLLFVEALSVNRIPALAHHMTARRDLFRKVLDGAQISVEEYEIMKDLIIPLGRVPQFSTQRGG